MNTPRIGTLRVRALVLPLTAAYLFFAMAGCGSSAPSTGHLDQYDPLPYEETFTLNSSGDAVHRAAVRALQLRGYVVTLSDPKTGLVNAEFNTASILPEEYKAQQARSSEEKPSVLWTILGIVLIFGLVILLINALSGDKDSSSSDTSDRSRRDSRYREHHEESKTASYRYVVMVSMDFMSGTSTEVHLSAIRMELENGGVINSGRMENKYLNYSLMDEIRSQLR